MAPGGKKKDKRPRPSEEDEDVVYFISSDEEDLLPISAKNLMKQKSKDRNAFVYTTSSDEDEFITIPAKKLVKQEPMDHNELVYTTSSDEEEFIPIPANKLVKQESMDRNELVYTTSSDEEEFIPIPANKLVKQESMDRKKFESPHLTEIMTTPPQAAGLTMDDIEVARQPNNRRPNRYTLRQAGNHAHEPGTHLNNNLPLTSTQPSTSVAPGLERHASICKYFPCPICGQKFDIWASARRHLDACHKEYLYNCTLCSRSYLSQTTCEYHCKLFHRVTRGMFNLLQLSKPLQLLANGRELKINSVETLNN